MDTVPIPEASIGQASDQAVPVQQRIVTPNPMQPPHENNLRKVFNISSWVILFALLPVTVLIFLSQDSIPGDFFYPVKRSMENVILAAASVNPATRAAFRTDLTATRFKEAQSLVVSKSNASGLSTFIDDVQSTQLEVISLKSDTERERAEEKLINKLEEYESGLSALEAKTEQNIIASAPNLPSPTPTFTPTPTVIPTSTLVPTSMPQPSSQLQPTATLTPSPTQAPTTIPTVPTTSETASVHVLEQRRIAESIKDTREKLDKIKKDLEENRKEEKEKREERQESEKKDKKDGERKDNSDLNK